MKNYFKKFGIIFAISFVLMLGNCVSAFASDLINYEPQKDYSGNLVAKWIFDNTDTKYVDGTVLKDVSGHGYNGIMSNVTFNTDKDLGTCGYFNGKNSFVKFSNPIIPQNKFFIIIKMKVTDILDNQSNRCILSNQDEPYDYSGIDIRMLGNNIAVSSQRQETATANSYIWKLSNPFNNYNNEEVIAISYDNTSKKAKFYENNLLLPVSEVSTSNEVPKSKYNFSIGISNSTHAGYVDKGYYKGYIKSIEVYDDVLEYKVKDPEISLNKSTDNLQVGETDNLVATTTPAGAQVNWSSSDESIATVDENGNVTGIKEGQATITASINDGSISATCTVTVTPKTSEPTEPQDPVGDGTLFIELVDGNIKSYDVSSQEITNFINWYKNRDLDDSQSPVYKFKNGDYTDYVVHDKIDWFEVR
ncbi:Ig-like domain-containing protein [Clostridium diolis]|uniref:Ig-like domain-containing protein n=1 Tax=Clostridium diolis TaxID=223919 RepID=UPI003AF4C6F2